MRTFSQNESLTDAQFSRLGDFLGNCKGGNAMNVEQLDGFFAALVAGPGTVMPSESHPEVFGGERSDTCEFATLDEANEILALMMRHWNTIAATLHKGEVYAPLLWKDGTGVASGNDWAQGFMRGIEMRHDGWAELVDDEEHGGCLIPMMMLCQKHEEDPEIRPDPVSPREARRSHGADGGWARGGVSVLLAEPRGWWGLQVHIPAADAHRSQGRAERALSVRLGEEAQEMLRQSDCALTPRCRTPRLGQSLPPRSAIIEAMRWQS
jgi:uncharacterized protein